MMFRLPLVALLTSFAPLVAAQDCTYETLTTLVGPDCADLESALAGNTVFGPCDYAFDEFLEETGFTAAQLCGPLKEELTVILTYHVVAGTITVADILASDKNRFRLTTLHGSKITINKKNLRVNGNDIVDPDALVTPYTLHGSNGVLIPPGFGGKSKGKKPMGKKPMGKKSMGKKSMGKKSKGKGMSKGKSKGMSGSKSKSSSSSSSKGKGKGSY